MQVKSNNYKYISTPLAKIASLVYIDMSTLTVLRIYPYNW